MNSYYKLIEISQGIHPNWGMYIHICNVIKESKLSRRDLSKMFTKFMPKDEYDNSERGELLDYLELMANEPYNIRN